MRETVRSLRVYFILSGLASLWFGFLGLAADLRSGLSPSTVGAAAIGIIGLGLAFAFLYVGAVLPRLLRSSSQNIVLLLYVSIGWAVLSFVLSLSNGVQGGTIIALVASLLILWYLHRNVRRLSTETQQSPPSA
jgi:membrane associated rhomboid family serine protease